MQSKNGHCLNQWKYKLNHYISDIDNTIHLDLRDVINCEHLIAHTLTHHTQGKSFQELGNNHTICSHSPEAQSNNSHSVFLSPVWTKKQ